MKCNSCIHEQIYALQDDEGGGMGGHCSKDHWHGLSDETFMENPPPCTYWDNCKDYEVKEKLMFELLEVQKLQGQLERLNEAMKDRVEKYKAFMESTNPNDFSEDDIDAFFNLKFGVEQVEEYTKKTEEMLTNTFNTLKEF